MSSGRELARALRHANERATFHVQVNNGTTMYPDLEMHTRNRRKAEIHERRLKARGYDAKLGVSIRP